jgi:tetratricopeptide (TPR) repeat protein
MEFNVFNLGGLNFSGLKVEANLGSRRGKAKSSLSVPLRTLNPSPSLLACLSWHTRASRFVGRKSELEALVTWCDHPTNLSLKFIHGEGGAGKSRLAAELALSLRKRGWSAGFLSTENQESVLAADGKGALIIVDYPEEGPALLGSFLKRLRVVEATTKLRVLCLSRQMPQEWAQAFSESGTTEFVDGEPIALTGVGEGDAYDLFSSALEEISGTIDTYPNPISIDAFQKWYESDGFHANPLYLVAAAARAAFIPDEPALSFAGQNAIRALAQKEQDRLRRLAEAHGLPPQAFVEIATGAILQDGLSWSDLSRFTKALPKPFILSQPDDTLEAISRTDELGLIHFDMPDVLGACFVAEAFQSSENAGDLLWISSTIRPAPLERFARIASDAQLVLGEDGKTILDAAAANLEVEERFESYLYGIGLRREQTLDPVLWPFWTAIHIKSAETVDEPVMIVSSLCNAGLGLSNQGRHTDALKKLERARNLLRTIAVDPRLKYQETANISLNMGRALTSTGQCDRAIRVLQDAVKFADRAASATGPDLKSPEYWEAQDTVALAYDNVARAWGLLDKPARGIHFSRRACALAAKSQVATGRPPTWSELNFRINLVSALAISGHTDEALEMLSADEADLRSRSKGGRTDFSLTMNLFHQASLANGAYSKDDLPEERWLSLLDLLDEAIAGSDRMLAASPVNMIKMAAMTRIVQADILLKLDDVEAWLAMHGAVYRLLMKHRFPTDFDHGLHRAATFAATYLPAETAESSFFAAFGADGASEIAWRDRAHIPANGVHLCC